MSISDTKAFGLDKSDVIIEQVPLLYQPISNIELIREILISELYPFIDENVYMETYTIKDNIIYKLTDNVILLNNSSFKILICILLITDVLTKL